jgi:hypothetical protein
MPALSWESSSAGSRSTPRTAMSPTEGSKPVALEFVQPHAVAFGHLAVLRHKALGDLAQGGIVHQGQQGRSLVLHGALIGQKALPVLLAQRVVRAAQQHVLPFLDLGF